MNSSLKTDFFFFSPEVPWRSDNYSNGLLLGKFFFKILTQGLAWREEVGRREGGKEEGGREREI